MSSGRPKCCALHECPQCGVLARHLSTLSNGGFGPLLAEYVFEMR
ncbi:hypothetical protein Z950_994 [Sulfitobacter mediterraneus KCTC 32188]|nr:hypothetical protein Z950_994 [Sulfitobacter mediterraneus KCTC 32188]